MAYNNSPSYKPKGEAGGLFTTNSCQPWCKAVLRVLTLTPVVCYVGSQHGLCGFGEETLKETYAEAGRWLALIGIVSREMAEFL